MKAGNASELLITLSMFSSNRRFEFQVPSFAQVEVNGRAVVRLSLFSYARKQVRELLLQSVDL